MIVHDQDPERLHHGLTLPRFAQKETAGAWAPGTRDGDRLGRVMGLNGVSALHRIGVHSATEGRTLAEVGLDDEMVRDAYAFGIPVTHEVERPSGVTVVISCIPLLERGEATGAVVLIRDISELRRRDLLLLSKDATIREIHHRVKNNLQTISSLLRLQGRRLESTEAKAAVAESVRRIRTIALVHETLSREPGSVLSNCLAEIDPINCSLRSNKRPSLVNVLGARWRKGLARYEDMHETARLRWAANASYRPAPLAPFADDIMNAVREDRAA